MSRATPEWIGKNDDQAIPTRVKDRVAQKANCCCAHCGNKVGAGIKAEFDHVIPIIIGGQHREGNLQLLCAPCHGAKTKLDVKLKAKIARVRTKNLGIAAPRKSFQSRGFSPSTPQRSASRPLEKRT